MTMRMLYRLARVLPRSSRASSVASALVQATTTQPAELLCPQARTRTLVATRSLCDRHSVAREEDSQFTFKRTQFDEQVSRAKSPEQVLRLWEARRGSANQAAMCLVQMGRLALEKRAGERRRLLNDPSCVALLNTISNQVPTVWNGTLVSALRAASQLDMPPGDAVLHSLQTEALWRVRRLSYKQLAFLMDWVVAEEARLARLGPGPGQAKGEATALANELTKQLELRWTELSEPRTVRLLMGCAAHLPPTLIEKLEDKALELAENFVAEDIRRVAQAMASQNRRTVPLLRALSYHFLQRPSKELSTPLLLDIAYAYGKLNFHQTQVFQRVASELLPRTPDLSATDVMRCAKSFAFLRWLHLPVFEAFSEHYVANSKKYSTLQLCNLLMTLAKLNFQPSKGEAFFTKVHSALKDTLPQLEPFLQVDVVWSLCVMQQAKPEYISALTQPSFQEKLSGGSPARVESYRVKLLHIVMEGSLGGLGSSVPTPSPEPAAAHASQPSELQTALHAALTSLTESKPNTLRTSVATCYGWTLDGELILDSENKPIELDALIAPHLPGGGGDKPLPDGARRMGFVTWEFHNFILRSKELLGRFAMQKRHLQLAGFLLVEVPYYEWLELKTDWQRVAYLKDKMGKAVAEEMAK
ncbi:FAST kinase domain-containing protein 4 [Sardina pilchardus]|uniref:FAST kinase domain-containing protein 4 n=1 Tax=Sardina pilchardus TaxID=27697 RepID=UPI002E1686A9